jgi:hypothetical protein
MESFIVNENGEHKGGRIVCSVCGNRAGVRWTKNRRGNDGSKWTDRITCRCGSTERFYIHSGKIIEQKLAKVS